MKFLKHHGWIQKISEWASLENVQNAFPQIPTHLVGRLLTVYKKIKKFCSILEIDANRWPILLLLLIYLLLPLSPPHQFQLLHRFKLNANLILLLLSYKESTYYRNSCQRKYREGKWRKWNKINPINSLAGNWIITVCYMDFLHLMFVNCWRLFWKLCRPRPLLWTCFQQLYTER